MSSITDTNWRQILRPVPGLVLVAALFILLQPAMLLVSGRQQAVRAIFGTQIDPSRLPAGVSILEADQGAMSLAGVDGATARALYRLGAIIVLPIRASGCLASGNS